MSDFDDLDPLAGTKEVFHAWLRRFDAFHDDEYLFEQLADCDDFRWETLTAFAHRLERIDVRRCGCRVARWASFRE
jgi:hypothetical protein